MVNLIINSKYIIEKSFHYFEAHYIFVQEKDITLSGEHVREGLTCVISVKVPNPEFEGQTKVLPICINPDVE